MFNYYHPKGEKIIPSDDSQNVFQWTVGLCILIVIFLKYFYVGFLFTNELKSGYDYDTYVKTKQFLHPFPPCCLYQNGPTTLSFNRELQAYLYY